MDRIKQKMSSLCGLMQPVGIMILTGLMAGTAIVLPAQADQTRLAQEQWRQWMIQQEMIRRNNQLIDEQRRREQQRRDEAARQQRSIIRPIPPLHPSRTVIYPTRPVIPPVHPSQTTIRRSR